MRVSNLRRRARAGAESYSIGRTLTADARRTSGRDIDAVRQLAEAPALRQNSFALRLTKEQIVDEIRRTAKEHGGSPLGQARFFVATGIKTSDWHGKYWARWGDALSEAGFSRNTLQEPYPEALLIQKFIALTRELSHFPVKGELSLKRKTDLSFPNDKTFGRFGGKASLIWKVLLYCRERTGFEDIIEVCETAGSSATEPDSQQSVSKSNVDVGFYVYLIKSGRHHKVGSSNSEGRGDDALASHLPDPAK